MLDTQQLAGYRGQKLVDANGDKIGKIEDIYIDNDTERPEWALVNTGLFGSRSHFAPLRDATIEGEDLRVPYSKDKVKDAPSVDADGDLSEQEEAELYRYYGFEGGTTGVSGTGVAGTDETVTDVHSAGVAGSDLSGAGVSGTGVSGTARDTGVAGERDTVGRDVSGPTTDDAMTRSEEEVRVGKAEHEVGRARLRKYVDTERVTETVPVQREEIRVEREPITDANVDEAMDGPSLSEEEHEITLREEEAVVEKRAVPKERVRLDKDVVIDEQEVSEEVRKERIEMDEDARR